MGRFGVNFGVLLWAEFVMLWRPCEVILVGISDLGWSW